MNKKHQLFSRVASSSNQFSRILPKKMHHDKEHLYSQMLQLKQNLNQTAQENIRLKTKISILQKQKSKINKYFEVNHEASTSKGNSRANLLGSRAHDKQNMIIMNLKKMVRESSELNEFLKSENQKIKKHIKYSKINEMQIQKKILYDENKKLNSLIADYNDRFIDQEDLSAENNELKKFLEEEIEENKILNEQNQRYEQLLENLKKQFEVQIQKLMNKEKKLARDLALEKRKGIEQQKYIENLRGQLKSLQNTQTQVQAKKKPAKNFIRPASSIPYRRNQTATSQNVKPQTTANIKTVKLETNPKSSVGNEDEFQKQQTEKIKLRNQQLQKQLKEIKLKLNKNESDFQKIKVSKQPQAQTAKQPHSAPKIRNKIQIQDKKQQLKNNESDIYSNEFQEQLPAKVSNLKEDSKLKKKEEEEEDEYLKQFEQGEKEEEYEQIFDKKSDLMEYNNDGRPKQVRKSILQQNQNQKDHQEEILYKKNQQKPKQGPSDKKKKKKTDKNEVNEVSEKKNEKKSDKKNDDNKYKPDKKILSQIKQLLTYRMKAQRYPFSDLKKDIQSAETSQFTWLDLSDMLINEPFFLTPNYTKKLLQYCYQKQKIQKTEILDGGKLLEKLRKVIEQFELIDEEEQKQMIVRIAQMTSTYPEQLQSAFQQIKNGQQTVSKAHLIQMFQKLELEPKYIELIIAELSLCSTDIEHLNFYGFFQRFYLDGEEQPENHPIQEQESQQSYRPTEKNTKPKNKKQEPSDDDEEYAINNYKMNSGNMLQKPATYVDDEDIVSDDGRI